VEKSPEEIAAEKPKDKEAPQELTQDYAMTAAQIER
jgi:hypothetical protein